MVIKKNMASHGWQTAQAPARTKSWNTWDDGNDKIGSDDALEPPSYILFTTDSQLLNTNSTSKYPPSINSIDAISMARHGLNLASPRVNCWSHAQPHAPSARQIGDGWQDPPDAWDDAKSDTSESSISASHGGWSAAPHPKVPVKAAINECMDCGDRVIGTLWFCKECKAGKCVDCFVNSKGNCRKKHELKRYEVEFGDGGWDTLGLLIRRSSSAKAPTSCVGWGQPTKELTNSGWGDGVNEGGFGEAAESAELRMPNGGWGSGRESCSCETVCWDCGGCAHRACSCNDRCEVEESSGNHAWPDERTSAEWSRTLAARHGVLDQGDRDHGSAVPTDSWGNRISRPKQSPGWAVPSQVDLERERSRNAAGWGNNDQDATSDGWDNCPPSPKAGSVQGRGSSAHSGYSRRSHSRSDLSGNGIWCRDAVGQQDKGWGHTSQAPQHASVVINGWGGRGVADDVGTTPSDGELDLLRQCFQSNSLSLHDRAWALRKMKLLQGATGEQFPATERNDEPGKGKSHELSTKLQSLQDRLDSLNSYVQTEAMARGSMRDLYNREFQRVGQDMHITKSNINYLLAKPQTPVAIQARSTEVNEESMAALEDTLSSLKMTVTEEQAKRARLNETVSGKLHGLQETLSANSLSLHGVCQILTAEIEELKAIVRAERDHRLAKALEEEAMGVRNTDCVRIEQRLKALEEQVKPAGDAASQSPNDFEHRLSLLEQPVHGIVQDQRAGLRATLNNFDGDIERSNARMAKLEKDVSDGLDDKRVRDTEHEIEDLNARHYKLAEICAKDWETHGTNVSELREEVKEAQKGMEGLRKELKGLPHPNAFGDVDLHEVYSRLDQAGDFDAKVLKRLDGVEAKLSVWCATKSPETGFGSSPLSRGGRGRGMGTRGSRGMLGPQRQRGDSGRGD